MAFSTAWKRKGPSSKPDSAKMAQYSDRSLNYYADQVPDIRPRVRHLTLERGLQTVWEILSTRASLLLLGSAASLILRRRYPVTSSFLMGFLLQQALLKRTPEPEPVKAKPARERKDIDLELYALRAQRGDYGKIEVIPFK